MNSYYIILYISTINFILFYTSLFNLYLIELVSLTYLNEFYFFIASNYTNNTISSFIFY